MSPMYEYECPKCGSTAETMGRVPECCGEQMKRKISECNFQVPQIKRVTARLNGKEVFSA